MARTRYITRTIVTTECEVSYVIPAEQKFASVVVPVQGNYSKEDKTLDKLVRKAFATLIPDGVFVSIQSASTSTKVYRMLELEFMKLATVDGEGAEEIEADEEDEEDEQ